MCWTSTRYEIIDWDDPMIDDNPETNNLLHCQRADRLGVQAEMIVYEIFHYGPWAEVQFTMQTAEYAVVGVGLANIWLVLFKDSPKRGDWLRPVTGWLAERAEIREWEQATGERWKGRR